MYGKEWMKSQLQSILIESLIPHPLLVTHRKYRLSFTWISLSIQDEHVDSRCRLCYISLDVNWDNLVAHQDKT